MRAQASSGWLYRACEWRDDEAGTRRVRMASSSSERWPELSYGAWKDTAETLHLWTQIVGKVLLARAPWQNHSWHVALHVTARGLTTGPIPDGAGSFQIDFDFIDHVLWLRTSGGARAPDHAEANDRRGILCRRDDRAQRARPRDQHRYHALRDRRPPFASTRTRCTGPTTPNTRSGSGACCSPRMR